MKQPYLYILFFVLLTSISYGQQKTTIMDSNQPLKQQAPPVTVQHLQGLNLLLDKNDENTVYLTDVSLRDSTSAIRIENFKEFSMFYKVRAEHKDGLYQSFIHTSAKFTREENGRYKIMEASYVNDWIERKSTGHMWESNHSTPMPPEWRFVGYADDSTLYAVKALNYLKSLQQ